VETHIASVEVTVRQTTPSRGEVIPEARKGISARGGKGFGMSVGHLSRTRRQTKARAKGGGPCRRNGKHVHEKMESKLPPTHCQGHGCTQTRTRATRWHQRSPKAGHKNRTRRSRSLSARGYGTFSLPRSGWRGDPTTAGEELRGTSPLCDKGTATSPLCKPQPA